jgi:hypothetical protein
MKKIVLILLVTITSLSCNKLDKKIDYANVLDNCFSNTEIEILNEACTQFEFQLSENYPNNPIGLKYKQFLKDIGSLNQPNDLIKSTPKTILTKLKNSSVFDKIWIKYSDSYYEDDSHEIQVITNSENTENKTEYNSKDFYITNPKGEYLECLLSNQENKYVNEYLNALKEIGNISSQILAQGLLDSMKDKDYDDKAVRLIIAMNLFYELQLNLTE